MKEKSATPPQLDINDIEDIRSLSLDQLNHIPFSKVWINCYGNNCKVRTALRDYGIHPTYYWPVRKIFVDINEFKTLCDRCKRIHRKKLQLP